MPTPTSLTLKHFRDAGYLVDKVEYWNPFAKKRHDLFGFIDILATDGTAIHGIQCTTRPNMSARIKKIREHENYAIVSKAMSICVMGWYKSSGRWEHKTEWL